MPDPISLSALIIGGAIGGAAEVLIGKAADKTPSLIQRARSLFEFSQQVPAATVNAAIQAAVEAARQETLHRIKIGELKLDPHVADEMAALLDHPTFAADVANQVLFGGLPDFDRLSAAYINQPRRAGATAWDNLAEPLLDFFKAIKSHLQADPQFGSLVREVERLATLTRLDDRSQIIADATRQAVAVQERIAGSTAHSALSLENLVQIASRQEDIGAHATTFLAQQTITLSQIRELLIAVLAAGPDHSLHPAGALLLGVEETAYLNGLRERCNRLPLALAHDRRAQDPHRRGQVELARVYVDLQTTTAPGWDLVFDRLNVPTAQRAGLRKTLQQARARDGDARLPAQAEDAGESVTPELVRGSREDFEGHPLRLWAKDEATLRTALDKVNALESLAGSRALVLLGKPGSGKSTLVNHVAFTMAGAVLGIDQDWQAVLGSFFPAPFFPLRVVLRQWSAGLDPARQAGRSLVYQALETTSGITHSAVLSRLANPATLVLFDGLDEVPVADRDAGETFDRRRIIVDSVHDFAAAHPKIHLLVTSRVKPYREGDYQLPGIPVFELADLDENRIQRFVHLWYDELVRIGRQEKGPAAGLADRLLRALSQRQILREMGGTPLLLTMLAQVNVWAGLPESRAELYHDCVEQLLWEWEKVRSGPEGAAGGRSLDDLLREASQKCDVAINRGDVERKIWALTYQARAGSGRETADLPVRDIEDKLAEIYPRPHERRAWASRVTALMADRSGLLVETDPGHFTFPHRSFQEYLAACGLLEQERHFAAARERAGSDAWTEVVLLACGELNRAKHYNDTQALISELAAGDGEALEDWRRLIVAGQAWLEFGPHRADLQIGLALKARLPGRLTALMQKRDVPARLRLEAGLLASDLGARPDDLDAFVPISAQAKLGYDFRIGRYPVTNAGYQRFVDEGGYDRSRPWWTPEAIKDIESFQRLVDAEEPWPTGPRFRNDSRFNHATQPVVGISWYEANAYCTWLTGELRRIGQLNQTEAVRLPTEAEWEWAAAGSAQRKYPWGQTFETWRANTSESGLGQTTPVSMYPGGATPEGVYDMAGNVWEWMQDDYAPGKALRGGAYWNDATGVGSAARNDLYPRYGFGLGGLRVVVVPVSRLGPVLVPGS